MVLGRLTHYAFDALAISTVLAGVKKQTGFGYVFNLLIPSHCPSTWLFTCNCPSVVAYVLIARPATEQIPDSSIRTFANAYFGTGETLFNIISGTVVSSSYFEKKL